ncbi:F-box/LRR-repeat protein At3g48880-like isoform X2 [Nymphaea colorata]|nr:F-box/LRR-repeat protein At3g48880-like isoform X2 [Nymphaea colorata]XP_049933257.1 F-box/LRR-repeat protein At3g48880-like isoform X2 [Nymphaea colorata]XP_049933260.1 F-box/LRR-repeat protein At3g48880-like isoform X2 [Nymphaea colorata]
MRKGWEDLPIDILVNVFKRVRFDDLVIGVPAVCKHWREASKDPSCWQHLDFLQYWYRISPRICSVHQGSAPFHQALAFAISQSRQSMVSIKFPEMEWQSSDLLCLANSCPNIEHLSLLCPKVLYAEEFSLAISKCTKLRSMEVDDGAISSELLKQINAVCKDFTRLKVLGNVTVDIASAIVNHLPNLRHLDLSYCSFCHEALQLVLERCRGGLKSLDISNARQVKFNRCSFMSIRWKICIFALSISDLDECEIENTIGLGDNILQDLSKKKLRDLGVMRAISRLRGIASHPYQGAEPVDRNRTGLSLPAESSSILDVMEDIHAPYSDDGDQ